MSNTPDPASPKGLVLASYLARSGVGSRRRCESLVRDGRITVNGEVTTGLATRVQAGQDQVLCDGEPVAPQAHRYVLLHKPKGYVCSAADRHAEKLAIELIDSGEKRLFSIGRLDKDSEGLLLFTNDGALSERLTHPRFEIPKVYLAYVRGEIRTSAVAKLTRGIVDDGDRLVATEAVVVKQNPHGGVLRITVQEGKKREIRRMIRHLNCRVTRLLRIGFGPLELGRFQPGFFRDLEPQELAALEQMAAAGEGKHKNGK